VKWRNPSIRDVSSNGASRRSGVNPHPNFRLVFPQTKSRDSSVCIALGYGLDDRGSRVRFPAGAGNFSLHHRVKNGSGPPTQPLIQWVPGVRSPRIKRLGRKADHSPPSTAEVK
jgi:hypothetical protein